MWPPGNPCTRLTGASISRGTSPDRLGTGGSGGVWGSAQSTRPRGVAVQAGGCGRVFQCGFPGGSGGKETTCDLGDLSSIPGSGRSPGEGNGNPLQYPTFSV